MSLLAVEMLLSTAQNRKIQQIIYTKHKTMFTFENHHLLNKFFPDGRDPAGQCVEPEERLHQSGPHTGTRQHLFTSAHIVDLSAS
jgi:hypothetical protein